MDSRRRSKSASHHHSRSTADGSSSGHLLARLVSREEEVREINAALVVTSERLEAESTRANAAERRALDYFHRLRIATENRERAEQDSARLREELKLYKLQLDNAQKEIFRAQDIIDQVASQRNEAEADAAKARTKARRLQEEKLVMLAREEGRKMGYKEGLSIGRRIGYDEGSRRLTGPSDRPPYHPLSLELHDGDDNDLELGDATTDEERNDPRSHVQLRSGASIRQQPYVNDCVACSSLLTLITECAPNRHRLYVRSKLPHMRRRFLPHRTLFLSVSTRHLMDIARLPRPMNWMNRKPFVRYRSALARSHLPGPTASLSTTDGSQERILARPTSICHTRTNCNSLFPHPAPPRPNSRIGDVPLNQSQPQCGRLFGRVTMLIRPSLRHLFRLDTCPRPHPVLPPISRNMI